MTSEAWEKVQNKRLQFCCRWILGPLLLLAVVILPFLLKDASDVRGTNIPHIRGRIVNLRDGGFGSVDVIEIDDIDETEDDLHIGMAYSFWYNVSEPSDEDYECTQFSVNPHTHVCPYPDDHEKTANNEWDTNVMANIKHIFKTHPRARNEGPLGLVDIGAKIGVYTLTAAALGYQVVAVEPDLDNVKRLHKAIKLGGPVLEKRITVLHNGVSSHRGWHLDENGTETAVREIVLDDLRPFCTFKNAVMRIGDQDQKNALSRAGYLTKAMNFVRIYVKKKKVPTATLR